MTRKSSRVYTRRDIAERFWEKVDVRGPNECWQWTASQCGPGWRDGNGYGQFVIGNGRNVRAHRFVAKLIFGMFDERLVVMHSCDNRSCVNPSHLSLGTAKDNVADMDAKGRRVVRRNESHPRARLTDAQVAEIRRRHVKGARSIRRLGVSTSELAAEFNTTPEYVVALVNMNGRTV